MALAALATPADLADRGIDINPPGVNVSALLAAASDEVRAAAGVPISRGTWTLTIPGVRREWLRLPGQPIVSVATVKIGDDEVTDWVLVGGDLWRVCGWQPTHVPVNVTATVTGGLTTIPADIVDLVCSLAGAGIAAAADGYASTAGKAYESIDDYRVGYVQGSARTAGVMELPQATRTRLRTRFGGGAGLVSSR